MTIHTDTGMSLSKAIYSEEDCKTKERMIAVRAIVDLGMHVDLASYQFCVDPKQLKQWVRQFKKDGIDGLREKAEVKTSDEPCMKPECQCCTKWQENIIKVLEVNKIPINIGATLKNKDGKEAVNKLQDYVKTITEDNQKLSEANRDLNATKNQIKITTAETKKKTGRPRGRPKGQPPNRNTRPKNIDRAIVVDCVYCPKCKTGEHLSEKVSHRYDRVVEWVTIKKEYVQCFVNRRYCRGCKGQITPDIPGVAKYARTSNNHAAFMTFLNMEGNSHATAAIISNDVLDVKISRSWPYRNKIRNSKRLVPDYEEVKKGILDDPVLGGDESHWISGKEYRVALVATGKKHSLVKITDSRRIEELEEFLPGYEGIIVQDSYTGWLHIGSDHQVCLIHQRRIVKNDLKYCNPKGDVLVFLNDLDDLLGRMCKSDEIKDSSERLAAAEKFDDEMHHTMYNDWDDDGKGTIARYKKRYRREQNYYTTFLRKDGVPPYNNHTERDVRAIIKVRRDGGGNRSEKGAEANSILLTIKLTDRLNKRSFFDHLMRAMSGCISEVTVHESTT